MNKIPTSTKLYKKLIKSFDKSPKVNVYPIEQTKEEKEKAKVMEKVINYMFETNANNIRSNFYAYLDLMGKDWLKEQLYGIKTSWDNIEKYSNLMAKELGKKGGEATKSKLGKEHFKKISELGVKARYEKNKVNTK
jgi:GTPase SAR1 family protein